jgi:hypothetical protein
LVLPLRDRFARGDVRITLGDGRRQTVVRVADRIVQRGSGRFFISGYSGVGKSTFIRQVIEEVQFRLATDLDRDRMLFRVDLTGYNLDDVQTIGRQLMLQLHWEVERSGLKLSRAARQRLARAIEGATARSVERLRTRTESLAPKVEVTTPLAALGLGGSKEDRSEQRAVFDGFDVPTTLLELGSLVREIPRSVADVRLGLLPHLLGLPATLPRPVTVVTIDRVSSWKVLPQLADLFSTPDVTFLVVVPLGVRRTWLAHSEAGREDIPAFQDIYVPCLWDEIPQVLDSLVRVEALAPERREWLGRLASYLAFQSNGIPKRCEDLLFTHLDAATPTRCLRFGERDLADIEFCAELYGLLRRHEHEILGELFQGLSESNRDLYRRVAIAAVREFVSKGTIRAADSSHTVMLALEAMTEQDRGRIMRRALEVLERARLASRVGDAMTLSQTAREKVSRGHTVLMSAMLPDLPEGQPAERPSLVFLDVDESPPPRAGADLFEQQITRLITDATHGLYDIERVLGRGGMSIVYKAREVALERLVAIKVLPPSLTVDASVMERFRREAITSASLSHPNIVPIYRISEPHDPLAWYAMMFVEGPTLRSLIDGTERPGRAEAARLLGPVAAALDYAHSRGVVHRDIKPENLVRGAGGDYMVMDFGIAKSLQVSEKLTGTGMAIGTPRYMSPEQALAREVSAATDQYALAVVAFELLTGRVPFDGDGFHIAYQHIQESPPSVSELNAAVPPAAAQAVARALSKDPAQRFPSVAAFVSALAAA